MIATDEMLRLMKGNIMKLKEITVVASVAIAVSSLLADGSAQNEYVRVSCNGPRITVKNVGNRVDFNVFAPGYKDSFVADVFVEPVDDWELTEPSSGELPLRMQGGDDNYYKVRKLPEDWLGGGKIFFHNYWIKSNQGAESKDIVVPFGTHVTYTARKDDLDCQSDWIVGAVRVDNSSRIVFNRSWWNVVEWFYPALETPNVGTYPLSARDVQYSNELYDDGTMIVVGAGRIVGPNGKASEHSVPSNWREPEVIYAHPCAVFDLSLELTPELSQEQLMSVQSFVSWASDDGKTTYDEDNPLIAHHVASSSVGAYCITASFGGLNRVILVKVGVPKIHKISFRNDIDIKKDDGSGVYDDIDWRDNDLDGASDLANANADSSKKYHPIAYKSTDVLSANAVFKIGCTKVTAPSEFIAQFDAEASIQKLRFAPNESLIGWNWSLPIEFCLQGMSVTASRPFKSVASVGYESEYELAWEVGFGQDEGHISWHRSVSQHELYLTYKQRQSSYETVFHVSCTGANGATTDQNVVKGVWSKFAGRAVSRKDGVPLTYYHSFGANATDVDGLLCTTDGQCKAWADFLIKATKDAHGIEARIIKCVTSYGDGFCVKNWSFSGEGTSGDEEFPFRNSFPSSGYIAESSYTWGSVAEVAYVSGVRGQNNENPAALFFRHFAVRFADMPMIYDPSYGLAHRTHSSIDELMSAYVKFQVGNYLFFSRNPRGVQIGEVEFR